MTDAGDEGQSRLPKIREDLNVTGAAFLVTDAELALTFLSVAETTKSRETAERNIRNARTAYDTVQSRRMRYSLSALQTESLERTLVEVRRRLEGLGQTFPIEE